MGEFCGKAGLSPHTYSANAFHTLNELGGMDEVKKELEDNVVNVWKPEVIKMFKENKIDLPGGVILEGPPGTGKTTIIETLAREMDVPLFKMDYSKMSDSSYIHSISRHVAEIFEKLNMKNSYAEYNNDAFEFTCAGTDYFKITKQGELTSNYFKELNKISNVII